MQKRSMRCFAALLAECFVLSRIAYSQSPITIGGGDMPEQKGPTICERNFGDDKTAAWLGELVHPLCRRGDSDSLLAVYLYSAPDPIMGAIERDDLAMEDWLVIDASLDRAAKAGHAHDYTFDLAKLAAKKSTHMTAVSGGDLDEIRWLMVYAAPMLNERFRQWRDCSFVTKGDPDRARFCRAARENLHRSGSVLALRGLEAEDAIKSAVNPPPGIKDKEFHHILLETIVDSANESDWYARAASRLKSSQPTQ
jgi:hypothetical protein